MPRKHARMLNLSNALEEFLLLPRFDAVREAVKVEEAWEKISGRTIMKYTRETRFEKGILTVFLSSSVARNDLIMMQGELLKKINNQLQEQKVKEIRFL